MEWKPAVIRDDGFVRVPKRWLHLHYYEALNILFRFENSLRVFVYSVLKNKYGEKWGDCSFKMPGGESTTLKSLAAKRTAQAEAFGYLGFDIKSLMMHLTSGELVELVTADAYWPKFKPYFRAVKEIVKTKLLEVGTIRNSLAHFRPMRQEDVEVIKQNSRHTLLEVEKCLHNLVSQNLRVPTNSTETWYSPLATLGTPQLTTTLYYSTDERWVCCSLTFAAPMLSKQKITEGFYSYNVAKLNTPNMLVHFPTLRAYVTSLSEYVFSAEIDAEWNVKVKKTLYLVFRKDVLTQNVGTIETELKSFAKRVAEECELLQQDHLARGDIVQPISGYSWWQKKDDGGGSFHHSYDELKSEYLPAHPDEYWGERLFSSDMIAGVSRFPWMPEDVSKQEGFGD